MTGCEQTGVWAETAIAELHTRVHLITLAGEQPPPAMQTVLEASTIDLSSGEARRVELLTIAAGAVCDLEGCGCGGARAVVCVELAPLLEALETLGASPPPGGFGGGCTDLDTT